MLLTMKLSVIRLAEQKTLSVQHHNSALFPNTFISGLT